MASSRPIAAGEDYTPDDINNLRNDVLDPVGGHKHNGVDGAKVPFSNLDVAGVSGSTPPTGGNKSYNDIANHVASSQGQHGHNASVYMAGSNTSSTLIQAGTNSVGTITFPIAYSSIPHVVVTGKGGYSDIGEYLGYTVFTISTTQFVVHRASDSPDTVCWIAVGTKNP